MTKEATTATDRRELIYPWNEHAGQRSAGLADVELVDETLRDGLQSPSVAGPDIEDRIALVRLMAKLGIDRVSIGLPGAGEMHFQTSLALAQGITTENLPIHMTAAARTVVQDIAPIVEIAQKIGRQISAYTFIGTSPIRRLVEDWSLEKIVERIVEAVGFAAREGLDAVLVLEDTTRTAPDTLERVFTAGIEAGARTLCLCDTVGYSNPDGVRELLRFTRELIAATGEPVKIDFHGHNDRGLATINALEAARHGAHRIHGTANGVGERVGNCAMEQLLVNLELDGYGKRDLSALNDYSQLASQMLDYPIPISAPIVGRDAFRTATGVHAAAILKAQKKGDHWLANRVYSSVPAELIGREQEIEIGSMSGRSNVKFWLDRRGIPADDRLVNRILEHAKHRSRMLSEEEIFTLIREFRAETKPS